MLNASLGEATVENCDRKCKSIGYVLASIRSQRQYGCSIQALPEKHLTPAWTGMRVERGTILDKNGTSLMNFALGKVPDHALAPSNTYRWPPKRDRRLVQYIYGPIYLHNKFYVMATDEFNLNSARCLCVDGRLRTF